MLSELKQAPLGVALKMKGRFSVSADFLSLSIDYCVKEKMSYSKSLTAHKASLMLILHKYYEYHNICVWVVRIISLK